MIRPIRVLARLRVPLVVAVTAAAVAAPLGVSLGGSPAGVLMPVAADATGEPTEEPTPTSAPIRIAQANLQAGLSVARFQADVDRVFAHRPDFVTYNEVHHRQDAVLARAGYAIQRTPGTYTGATPVVWNTARWTRLDGGTYLISNRRGKSASQRLEWGIRYANWVTVQSSAGQVMSVISTHLAPKSRYTDGLLVPSLRRLGALAAQLRARGPVLIGGDLNVNFRDSRTYPRELMAELGLTPTFDVVGSAPPTGDYRNATIDYILLHRSDQFTVQRQWTNELHSDHDLLAADVALIGSSASTWAPGIIANDPSAAPSAVLNTVAKVVDKTPRGAAIHIATRQLGGKRLIASLIRAHRRGVHVQLITASRRPTKIDRQMARMLGKNVRRKSWAVTKPHAWRRLQLPAASVLASVSGGTPALRVDVNRALVPASRRLPMRARLATTKTEYDQLFVRFFRAVGRTI